MDIILYLIPAALCLGLLGLAAFLWALKSGQFDDLDGAAHRILFEDDRPLPPCGEETPPPAPKAGGADAANGAAVRRDA